MKKARIYSFAYESSIYMHIELYDHNRFSVTFDTDSFTQMFMVIYHGIKEKKKITALFLKV